MTTITADGTVEFMFYRSGAKDVKVAGDFTGWTQKALAMRPAKGGWWSLRIQLSGGEYRFRYLVDGNWYTDFAAQGIEMGRLGVNSVLVIPEIVEQANQKTVAVAA